MADFLTLYHDEIVWLAMVAVVIVIGILTNFGRFTKHKSIRWKVRLIALPVICAIVAFVMDDGPFFIDNLIFTFFLSVVIWFGLFFPPWYILDFFEKEDGDKDK